MSNKSNCIFKKSYNTNAPMPHLKNLETSLTQTNIVTNKKNGNYKKKTETTPIIITSENVVCLSNENLFNERKNFDIVVEEYNKNFNFRKNNKFNSPKTSKKSSKEAITSSSNLPTANNSFHTAISSPEQDKFQEDYQCLSYNKNKKTAGKNSNRKISSAESDLDSVELAEMNSLCGMIAGNSKKKSDDFKVKFKTEMCKFWDLYKVCKFGDNVSN